MYRAHARKQMAEPTLCHGQLRQAPREGGGKARESQQFGCRFSNKSPAIVRLWAKV